ncbi:SRPBCC family protein [Paraburkholderia caballeronis]|uniref:Polyketide cyclase / dehydrase and lipid transport n=1 Tax=Paraburkholderia caballeronis TaxID=416943 RepID=A0A1H7F2G6_9BURK|nr:SRPBCC family protein [Paraburkholderia caballeronis]PXW14567.1 polyketide cyclase/dehydrase/lipid transport protein [Paraburkholderia caballeronis]PXW93312.1 polyketide cyclase/dehydrase/lipid transport protein [Paraburkholderia caballeronis]RAJ87216.1 polyketide cyclase/dehydrase/lipid transport protein [Paraburkholderia caballeronis]TDV05001.1 polyketide cyclase/dehydrase/lipid transport protein [Paraburkholderia caballeronis]TDV08169.1 polyketide cyclase/dehydrase/lipid transport protei
MAQAHASIEVPVSPDTVWQLIGGFGSLPDWLPYIPDSELSDGGRVRRLANPDGDAIVERLVAFDDADRSYSYAILQAPFPVTGYRATLRVRATDDAARAKVEWSGSFTPVGISDDDASRLFQRIYEEGLGALAKRLGAGD